MKKSFTPPRVVLAILLALSFILMAAACGGKTSTAAPAASTAAPAASTAAPAASTAAPKDNGQKYVIRIGNSASFPSQANWIMREFKSRIEGATDRITVELYEGGAFGTNNEMAQGLQSGALQATAYPSGFFGAVAPKLALLELPGLFLDADEMVNVLNGDTPALDAYLAQQNIVDVAWFWELDNNFLTTTPINSLADFKGKNIRTYSVDVSQQKLQALGANTIQMATPDLAMALQQKTIDGVESCPNMLGPNKLYEFAKYYTQGLGDPIPNPIFMNKDFLESLPQDLHDLVIQTWLDICTGSGYDYAKEISAKNYQEMVDGGTVMFFATPELKQEYLKATEGVVTDFLKKNPDMQAAYDELTAAAKEYRSKK